MTNLLRFAFVSLTTLSVALAANPPLNLKPGGWEITTTTTVSGNPVPAGAFAQLPPAQRAKIEASLKKRAAAPRTLVSKTCITAKDLKDANASPFGREEEEKNCKTTVLTATGTVWQAAIACTGEMPRKGTMKLTAVSPTQMKGLVEMTVGTAQSTITQSGQWKSDSCARFDD
jgi:Protein of unknown function (DUF3617)